MVVKSTGGKQSHSGKNAHILTLKRHHLLQIQFNIKPNFTVAVCNHQVALLEQCVLIPNLDAKIPDFVLPLGLIVLLRHH